MQLTDSSNVYTSVRCQERILVQLDLSLMRYYDIVDRLLDLWRSQPFFRCGRHQYGRVNKLTRDSFRSSWAMNSENHGFWNATLVFNALILYPFGAFKDT